MNECWWGVVVDGNPVLRKLPRKNGPIGRVTTRPYFNDHSAKYSERQFVAWNPRTLSGVIPVLERGDEQ